MPTEKWSYLDSSRKRIAGGRYWDRRQARLPDVRPHPL